MLAAKHAGIEPLWSSEIEPFPCAVTKHHFPDVVQLGDITKLDGAKLWPVDIICAGSPCQDLSVAGKQEGLNGERSGLFRDAIRLVRDMRRASGGRYPRWFVWENVPGAFSSNKGADFKAVLEEIGQTSIPMPQGGKWANAGLAELPECEIAWRVIDAQHHVPQRRKRIFLVADFATERRCAGEILLISEGVRGDSAESGATREGFAARTESGSGSASGDCLTPWDCKAKRIYKDDGGFPCLQSTESNGSVYVPDKARSLTARNDGSPCVDRGPNIVAAGFNANASSADSMPILEEQTPPLRTIDRLAVIVAGFKAGAGADAGGLGYQVEQMPTLTSAESGTQRPTVAVYDMTHADEVMRKVPDGRAPTLNARMGTGGNQVPVVSFAMQRSDKFQESQVAHTLAARDYKSFTDLVCQKSVRRLTPTECERLQGLPDGYTLIDDKTCSDTARYKALGNGMAQPNADYVIRRIVEVVGE